MWKWCYSFWYLISIIVCWSCQTGSDDLSVVPIITNYAYDFDAVAVSGKRVYAVGGDTWYEGAICKYHPDEDAVNVDRFTNKRIFDVVSTGDSLWMAGVDGYLYSGKSGPSSFYRLSEWGVIKGLIATADRLIAVGGGSFRFGLVYEIDFEGKITRSSLIDQEMQAATVGSDGRVIACGYGGLIQQLAGDTLWTPLDVKGDLFTDIGINDRGEGYVVGARGAIWHTRDGGLTWQEIKGGSRLLGDNSAIECLHYDASTDRWWAAGAEGKLYALEDATWTEWNTDFNTTITDITSLDGVLYLVGKQGAMGWVKI